MRTLLVTLLCFTIMVSTFVQSKSLNLTSDWFNELLTNNKEGRGKRETRDESAQIHVTPGGKDEGKVKAKVENKHNHIYNIDLNTIKPEHHVQDAKDRFICLYKNICQNVSSYYVSPMNTFDCTNEYLLVHLDILAYDPENPKTLIEPETLQGVAFLPPKGQLQRYQKTTESCALVRK